MFVNVEDACVREKVRWREEGPELEDDDVATKSELIERVVKDRDMSETEDRVRFGLRF